MNGIALIFFLLNAAALLALPRRWAPLPLVLGTCYMTQGQGIVIGPFHFPVIRMLILVAFVRVLTRGERPAGGLNRLDWVMLAFGAAGLWTAMFVQTLVGQLGRVYDTVGIYFLIRTFCRTIEDISHLLKLLALALAPVALEMVNEQLTGQNLFAVLGDVPQEVVSRAGRFRAQGPFRISILAGTVGAACIPFMIAIWRKYPMPAKIGLAACLLMTISSASSGPLMSAIVAIFALALWRWRHLTRQMRIAAVVAYIFLDIVMKAPAYYLIARIDLISSSTGFHRAELIHVAIEHLNEWWFAGTNYTRHWMPSGVSWSEDHCDITNHYLFYGVYGGLPWMLSFIAALWMAFREVGIFLQLHANRDLMEAKFAWALGAALCAQAASCFSVAYFDQSIVILFLNLAIIGSLSAAIVEQPSAEVLVQSDFKRTRETSGLVGPAGI
jgi:hypothetical protein